MWEYIDALIPGVAGLLLIGFPRALTKAGAPEADKTVKKLRGIGVLLLVAAALIGASELFASS
jgi:uncharacterized protein YjeT (DUF2065 family)